MPLRIATYRAAILWVGLALAAFIAAGAQAASPDRDLIELRAYRLKTPEAGALLDEYLSKTFIPALNARGIDGVGAFSEVEPKEGPVVWVIVRYPSWDMFVSVTAALNADPAVQASGARYLEGGSKADPLVQRVDSWLYLAFAAQPRLAIPSLAKAGKGRILEMRMYESHNELKALKKIQMFNEGEVAVMQEVELSPVFFGQALSGPGLPRLVYFLCSADRETHAKNWKRFQQHPRWLEQKADPQYKDTVSRSDNRFLTPKPYSQL